MNDSLRVKNLDDRTGKTVRITERTEGRGGRRETNLVFRNMLTDAFSRKNAGLRLKEERTETKGKTLPSPYLYLRMLLFLVVVFIVSWSAFYFFDGYELYPLLVAMWALAVPLVILMFFYEMDTSRSVSVFTILIYFLAVIVFAEAVEMISYRFVYGENGLSAFGAMAIGLMESALMFLLCMGFVYRLKVRDMMTGMLIGAAVGAGFAIMSNINICFRNVFVSTQYLSGEKVLLFNETLVDSFNNLLNKTWPEICVQALIYVLIGAVFSGNFTKCLMHGKEKTPWFILITIAVVFWGFLSLWIMPFISMLTLFTYILKVLMTLVVIIAAEKTIKDGLAENVYN